MNYQPVAKPKYRSKWRRFFGKKYFIFKRYLKWYFGRQKMAANRQEQALTHLIYSHQTVLLRKLKDVDMHLQHNKIVNLSLAANKINGLIIQPGETFSYWYVVGQTKKSKGYVEGMMLQNGRVVKGIGGGLCQMGNLIFWMALHSPLTVVERWRHSYDVFPDANRTQPFGSGATLSYNYIDLQIKNETQNDFQINVWLDDSHLRGSLCSDAPCKNRYELLEKNHLIRGESWGGYTRHNQIYRKIYDKNNRLLQEEPLIENHAVMMYQPFLEQKGGY